MPDPRIPPLGELPTHRHDAMSPTDEVLWAIEHDPVLRSTITAIAVFDRPPDWDRLVTRIQRAVRVVPRLRQRVVDPVLGLGSPRWVLDDDVDLEYHLRRVRVPEPGDLRAVLDLAQPVAMAPFDRGRPLWEFTLVEGLADGRGVLVQKLHHSLTDGVGGVQLALELLDDRDDAPDLPVPPSPSRHRRPPTVGEVTAASAIDRACQLGRLAVRAPVAAARGLPRLPALVPSTYRMLRPVTAPGSPLLHGRSLSRRLDVLDVPVAQLARAGRAAGGTLNDAFLASVVGGMNRYHALHGSALDHLRVTMPINLRAHGDQPLGNRFTPARFVVDAAAEDPVERMRCCGGISRSWQREPAVAASDALAAALAALPAPLTATVFRSMLANVDLVCSDVPGVPQRSWLAGAELLREYAFAPPAGAACSVTLMSYADTACIGVASDPVAVTDPAGLVRCLADGFAEVVAVGA